MVITVNLNKTVVTMETAKTSDKQIRQSTYKYNVFNYLVPRRANVNRDLTEFLSEKQYVAVISSFQPYAMVVSFCVIRSRVSHNVKWPLSRIQQHAG